MSQNVLWLIGKPAEQQEYYLEFLGLKELHIVFDILEWLDLVHAEVSEMWIELFHMY